MNSTMYERSGVSRCGRSVSVFVTVLFLGLAHGLGAQDASTETVSAAVARAVAAYGSLEAAGGVLRDTGPTATAVVDSVSTGQITLLRVNGPSSTFNVTFVRKGASQIQRTIHQPNVDVRLGTTGSASWHSLSIGMWTAVDEGQPRHFIESQTVRSVESLLDHETRGLTLTDRGRAANARVVEAAGSSERRTEYHIDDATSMVTRLEFVTGQRTDAFGNTVPATEAYVFSDFRTVRGRATPFKVERWIDGVKYEEMVFTSVSYNTDVADSTFQR